MHNNLQFGFNSTNAMLELLSAATLGGIQFSRPEPANGNNNNEMLYKRLS